MSQLPYQNAQEQYFPPADAMGEASPDPSTQAVARLLNAATTTFPVNLSFNGVPQVAGSGFSSLTSYIPVPASHQTAVVTKSGSSNALLLRKPLEFDPGSRSTLVLTDSASEGMDLLHFRDQAHTPAGSGQSFIRTANVSMEGSSFVLNMAGGTIFHDHLPFGWATPYSPLNPGPYSFYVSEDSGLRWTTGPLAAASLEMKPGAGYTLYLLGNTWSSFGFSLVPVQDS